ncbi:MAG: hypothetical protein HC888_02510 [Candidatus Competibacteraceae bacterium]|nr:hypothetical protein [Candidatus Competibacteraceae bacterium]
MNLDEQKPEFIGITTDPAAPETARDLNREEKKRLKVQQQMCDFVSNWNRKNNFIPSGPIEDCIKRLAVETKARDKAVRDKLRELGIKEDKWLDFEVEAHWKYLCIELPKMSLEDIRNYSAYEVVSR